MNFFGSRKIINDASIKLIFGNISNYFSCFKLIHENFNNEDFLENKDTDINTFSDMFLSENDISFNDIKKDKLLLKKFVKGAKRETDITLTDLANFLGLSRNIVGYHFRMP